MKVPRLAKGKGLKGPEFYGCFNTGMAPCIFHSRTGKYVVGPQLCCQDAMHAGLTGRKMGAVYIYKNRASAVHRFMVLCGAQILENYELSQKHKALQKASAPLLAAPLPCAVF